MLVGQIYVDDIIFGATNQGLCKRFAKEMQNEFEMSMMGELTFFPIYKSSNVMMGSLSTKLSTSRICLRSLGFKKWGRLAPLWALSQSLTRMRKEMMWIKSSIEVWLGHST